MIPNLAIAFIALILVRQAIVLAFPTYATFLSFITKKKKISALFLSDTPWHPEIQNNDDFMEL